MSAYPGFYAIPGSMFPGAIWPAGTPAPVPVLPAAIFTPGTPYFQWETGTPYFEWAAGTPYLS